MGGSFSRMVSGRSENALIQGGGKAGVHCVRHGFGGASVLACRVGSLQSPYCRAVWIGLTARLGTLAGRRLGKEPCWHAIHRTSWAHGQPDDG
jgi:hypothetical protein